MIRIMCMRVGIVVLTLLGCIPATAFAQSSIVGVVKDASGGVLPGVTVEAMSPVLIEKVRTVITDDQGLYRIVDLRPGTYVVTMTLPGFATVKRDGLELPAAFTATMNGELRVSDVAETLTVTGQAPMVDTQNVAQSTVFSKNLLENLPTASRTPQSFVAFVPGVVGGLNVYALAQKTLSIHGGRPGEADTRIDGFSDTGPSTPGGGGSTFYTSPITVQETSVVVSGHAAEYMMSGIVNNVIPKEGSNLFRGSSYVTYNDENMAWSNFSDALKDQGVTAVFKTQKNWEVAGGLGGPLVRDKVWFFSSIRDNNLYRQLANLYLPKDPLAWVYTPDVTRPAIVRNEDQNYTTRVTWQASAKNKFVASLDWQPHTNYQQGTALQTSTSTESLEASAYTPQGPNYMTELAWRSPVSSHLYLEAGMVSRYNSLNSVLQTSPIATAPDTIAAIDRGGLIPGLQFRAYSNGYGYNPSHAYTYRASASYISGAHDSKVGFIIKSGTSTSQKMYNQDVVYILNNGTPSQVVQYAGPIDTQNKLNADLGIYVQDQWRLGRATINLGLRYDYLHATAIGVDQAANRWMGPRSFSDVQDVPKWQDLSPRFGAAFDLFGNGKTALKVSLNRYVTGTGTDVAAANNPVTTAVTSATRTWADSKNFYVPDCDFTITAANGECGKLSNLNFGNANPNATKTDADVLTGYKKRGYNWETSVSVQHELRPGMSVSAGYFRRFYGNFTATDNLAVSPADFSQYCITAPVDPRLPADVSGQQICGLYDVSPAKFGTSTNFTTFASKFGEQTEVFNGVDFSGSLRLPKGAQATGGVSYGRTETNKCFVVDSPGELRFCNIQTPFLPNIKMVAAVPLPWWGLQASMALQNVPGPQETATYTATNAQIAPLLGRNLAAGSTGTASIELIKPGTLYGPRVSQLDVRLAKTFALAGTSLRASVMVYNLLNSDGIQSVNLSYAPTAVWPQPTLTLDGRFIQFNAQIDF